jgi:hypothetical protein
MSQYSDGSKRLAAATKNSGTNDVRKTLPIRNRCGDSINSARRPERLPENYFASYVDFDLDRWHAHVTDKLHAEDLALNSHPSTSELKQVRLRKCLQLLAKLCAYVHDNCWHLVTKDESWFYHEYVQDSISTTRDENAPEVETKDHCSQNSTLTVFEIPTASILLYRGKIWECVKKVFKPKTKDFLDPKPQTCLVGFKMSLHKTLLYWYPRIFLADSNIQGVKKVPGPMLFRAVLFLIKIQTPDGIIENCWT